MGQRQYEPLAVVIQHRKGQLVIVVHTLGRGLSEEVQSIVHPPHVPLVVKPESALVQRLRYIREVGGVLRTEYRRGMYPLKPPVEAL